MSLLPRFYPWHHMHDVVYQVFSFFSMQHWFWISWSGQGKRLTVLLLGGSYKGGRDLQVLLSDLMMLLDMVHTSTCADMHGSHKILLLNWLIKFSISSHTMKWWKGLFLTTFFCKLSVHTNFVFCKFLTMWSYQEENLLIFSEQLTREISTLLILIYFDISGNVCR